MGDCNDRSEQVLLDNWLFSDSRKYFTIAIYLPSHTDIKRWNMPTQWWQSTVAGGANPPLFAALNDEGNFAIAKRTDPECGQNVRETLYEEENFQKNTWHYFMFGVDFGIDNQGSLVIWTMNLPTGIWHEKFRDDHTQIGWKWGPKVGGSCVRSDSRRVEWKAGTYRGSNDETTRIYLDNLSHRGSWDDITNHGSTGYHRNLVSLDFEDSGSTAQDSSGDWNDGWSFNSDGELKDAVRWPNCRAGGNCIGLDGVDDYVQVPVDEPWFDTGNYLTLGTFFASHTTPNQDGLVSIDRLEGADKSGIYKARLELKSENEIRFVVRHPDQSTSEVSAIISGSFSDWTWRHALGTYNRFAPDGKRLKLYLNGLLVASKNGVDKPILKGVNHVYGGRSSVRYFEGVLDEMAMFNFALDDDDVSTYLNCLWNAGSCAW